MLTNQEDEKKSDDKSLEEANELHDGNQDFSGTG
jgi:hypothetical protein